MNLCDIRVIQDTMSAFGIRFHKEFGQNFLTNRMVVEDIADSVSESGAETVLEIGPGIGTLTRELSSRYQNVIALEIDRGLIPVLEYTLDDCKNVTVINEDVMKADLSAILAPYLAGGISVCANLPYYITTPILMRLLESGLPFRQITVMVQAEVAARLCSPPGGKDCGAITTVVSYYGQAEKLFLVSAGNFMPPPKVDSTVVRITLHQKKPYHPKNEAIFFRTVKAAFEQRRKTLPNALSAVFSDIPKETIIRLVTSVGLDANIRGERLDTATFVRLSDAIAGELGK